MRTRTFSPSDQIFIERLRCPSSLEICIFRVAMLDLLLNRRATWSTISRARRIVRAMRRLSRRGIGDTSRTQQCQRKANGYTCFLPPHN